MVDQYKSEIEQYSQQLDEGGDFVKTLRQVVEEAIGVEKEGSWLITQRYSYQHASILV